MKKRYSHTEAANFLTKHNLPREDEIDAMGAVELAAFLSSRGVDVSKFNTELDELQKQLTGKLTLAQARKQRLAADAAGCEMDLSHMSEDEFKSALLAKFRSYEEMPFAARNHKSMNREDWESLYRDHCTPRKK